VRSTQGWKVSFWASEQNSVWVLKWTTLLGIFCKIGFTPAASYYQVHVLNADAHLPAALLCYFRCYWCRNLAAVHCILQWIILTPYAADGHYTRNSSCITLLWLHHNHKMPISYHKNGLVSSHQCVGRWLIFMCFVVKIFWRNYLAINSLLVFVSRWNSFMCIVFTSVQLYSFVSGSRNCVREIVFRFTRVVLWKLHG